MPHKIVNPRPLVVFKTKLTASAAPTLGVALESACALVGASGGGEGEGLLEFVQALPPLKGLGMAETNWCSGCAQTAPSSSAQQVAWSSDDPLFLKVIIN